MSRVVHFEIQADDIERAKRFYGDVFAWSFQDYGQFVGSPYWGVITGPDEKPGINGGLLQRPAATPGQGQGTNAFVCTMEVDDYDRTEQRILAAGGSVALPKMALKGMAWQGYYRIPRATRSGSTSQTPARLKAQGVKSVGGPCAAVPSLHPDLVALADFTRRQH
jgi:predicted enzyme related to lactoylglutathione lyase